MNLLYPLKLVKRKMISWLAYQLILEQERKVNRIPPNAQIAPTAILAPEASIDNGSRDEKAIIVGEYSYIRGRLLTFPHGGRISVGEWCYIGHRTEIWSMASVTIGHRVFVAHGVNITDTTAHARDPRERHFQYQHIVKGELTGNTAPPPGVYATPITIEDDVWINLNVTILRGVRIGRGSIIAAGAIVTSDVPPYTLYRCQITPVMTPLQELS